MRARSDRATAQLSRARGPGIYISPGHQDALTRWRSP
jgi:hypothetical protein